MKQVRLDKNELIAVIQANREIHAEEFKEAWQAYVKACKTSLDKISEKILSNGEVDYNDLIKLPRPRSHVSEYDETLEMLAWEQGENIILERREFKEYVLDDWSWKSEFAVTSSTLAAYNGPH